MNILKTNVEVSVNTKDPCQNDTVLSILITDIEIRNQRAVFIGNIPLFTARMTNHFNEKLPLPVKGLPMCSSLSVL